MLMLCIVTCVERTYVYIFSYSLCGTELLFATDLGMLGLQKGGFICAPVIAVLKKLLQHELENMVEHQHVEQRTA